MIMQLNQAGVTELRDAIRSNPLGENEIRRVEGKGEQYIALETAQMNDEDMSTYTEMYALSIDGVGYKIYAKVNTGDSHGGEAA
tara:strand:- start:9411 stop:9662 length:252 start_codon:yes stop_codon:yes gene_type:complete